VGNSLALRIPRPFAEEVKLQENSAVEVTVRAGKLLVVPLQERDLTLDSLVDQITESNRHGEVGTRESIGNEIW
jgi:antitoxin MazE